MSTDKKITIEVLGFKNSEGQDRWIATLTYGRSIGGRDLNYKAYGYTMGEAVARMGKIIKREGVPGMKL